MALTGLKDQIYPFSKAELKAENEKRKKKGLKPLEVPKTLKKSKKK